MSQIELTAIEKLELAERQLGKVLSSLDPVDSANVSHFGFHALENAVDAMHLHLNKRLDRTHPARVKAAKELHEDHGLDDVSQLLKDLNETRKSESYGDVPAPELNLEREVTRIQEYMNAVREIVES